MRVYWTDAEKGLVASRVCDVLWDRLSAEGGIDKVFAKRSQGLIDAVRDVQKDVLPEMRRRDVRQKRFFEPWLEVMVRREVSARKRREAKPVAVSPEPAVATPKPEVASPQPIQNSLPDLVSQAAWRQPPKVATADVLSTEDLAVELVRRLFRTADVSRILKAAESLEAALLLVGEQAGKRNGVYASAPASAPAPAPVPASPSTPPAIPKSRVQTPHIVICGLNKGGQVTEIEQAFRTENVKFSFLDSDTSKIPNGDECILMTKFINHSQQPRVMQAIPRDRVHLVHGGMTMLKAKIGELMNSYPAVAATR